MIRTLIGATMAAAFAATLSAQPFPATSQDRDHDKKDVTVTGCLARDTHGNFFLDEVNRDRARATSGTTTTTEEKTEAVEHSWKLEGSHGELDRHIGQRVEVIGREHVKDDTATTTGAREHAHERVLDVRSVKSTGRSCS